MARRSNEPSFEDLPWPIQIVVAIFIIWILFWGFFGQSITEWWDKYWLWIILGIVILVVGGIMFFLKIWLPIDKESQKKLKKEEQIEKNIIRKRLLKERSKDLEGLNEEEREHQLKKWIEEEYKNQILGITKKKTKLPRKPIRPSLRQAILRAYDSRCAMCGRFESVDIHHIDGNRSNPNPRNLIPLCAVCHRKHFTIDQIKAKWRPPKYRKKR